MAESLKLILRLMNVVSITAAVDRCGLPLFKYRRVSANKTLTSQKRKGRKTMRSDLIFGALTHVNNRYELCQLASKATRSLHKPNTRLQATTKQVFDPLRDPMPMNVADT